MRSFHSYSIRRKLTWMNMLVSGAALLLARDDLEQMDRNIMDPEGRRRTTAGQTNAMIGAIVSLLGILVGALHALVYFGKMW